MQVIDPKAGNNSETPGNNAATEQVKLGSSRPTEPSHDDESSTFRVLDRRFWAQSEEGAEATEERPSAPSYVEELKRELAAKDTQLREYISAYKKEVVENLEQTKARLTRDAEQQSQALRGEMAQPMMDVLDTLERSLTAAEAHPDVATLIDGLKMVLSLMVQKLSLLGLQRVATVGETFDPKIHDAVGVTAVEDPARDNTIIAEVSAGFTLDGRTVRPAKVLVGKLAS